MNNSVIFKFVQVLKEYSFILNRDFGELVNVQPHKREVFINKGVKIFLGKILEEMKIFNLNIQHYIDTRLAESFIDIVVSMKVYRETICEYIIFSPIKGHIFYTDRQNVYFNEKVINTYVDNKTELVLNSANLLFLPNMYPCYLLIGCFKEIQLESSDLEQNKYGLELVRKHPHSEIEEKEGITSITLVKEKIR